MSSSWAQGLVVPGGRKRLCLILIMLISPVVVEDGEWVLALAALPLYHGEGVGTLGGPGGRVANPGGKGQGSGFREKKQG